MRLRTLSAVALALFVCAPARPQATPAPALPAGVTQAAAVEGITEYRLANGLRVLLFPDPSKETLTVNVTYLVGSKHENYGETGMAHLLEHLVFKGTATRANLIKEFEQHGARWNGTTWVDRTNYFETMPASDENLQWALAMEADRMVNSRIAKGDLDSEMTVVRNEFEMGENSPNGVLFKRVMAAAYDWHNYGKSTIGARSDIENVPIDRLQAFYRTWYQPDNAIITIAGRFDPAKALGVVAMTLGAVPKPTRPLPKAYTEEPTQDGERTVTLKRVGDVQLLMAAYHIPAGPHADFAAVDVLSTVLGDVPSGRLHKALVETKKAASAGAFNFQLNEPGLLMASATVRQEMSLDEARTTMLRVLDNIASEPPTPEEVERAKTKILKQWELNINNSDRVGIELSEWASQGDWRLLFLHRDRVRAVKPEDVARVAKAYLKDSNRTLGTFQPEKNPVRAEIPKGPDVAALLKDYKGGEAVAQGEAFDPAPENVERRSQRAALPNGLKLTLLPKKTRGNSVAVRLALHFGDENSLKGKSTAASLASQMLMRGTARKTRQQIADELDKLKARMNVFGGATSVNVNVETTRPNLPGVMALMTEVLREPSFPADEFEQLRQQRIAGVEQGKSEPTVKASTAMGRHMNARYSKGDVRYVQTPEEQVEELRAVTLDDVKAFHRDFYGASHAELTVVGDVDGEEIQKSARALLGDWKSPKPFTEVQHAYEKRPVLAQDIEAPDKANAFFMAGLPIEVSDDDPDYPALLLGNYMLGGSINSRLFHRIRGKDGLSYGAGSNVMARTRQKSGIFQAFAISAPQNAAKVEAAFKEEVAKALKEGFTEEEIRTAKSGWKQEQQVSRSQDGELAGRLTNLRFYDRTMAWQAELEAKVAALTNEQILVAMRKHIDPAQISYVKAGDWKKLAATPGAGGSR